MKKILFLLLLLPALLQAQTEKYMAGAVPEIDGRVVFTRELNVQKFSQEQIYEAVMDWANQQTANNTFRIIYNDPEKKVLAINNQDEMLIRIGLFPGKVKALYNLTITTNDGKCVLETSRIRYKNNPSSPNSEEILRAEEYITDKFALNKSKTKLFKGTGDYRSKTIDLVDKMALDIQNAVYAYHTPVVQQPEIPLPTAPASKTATTEVNKKQENHAAQKIELTDQIKQAISQRGLYVTAVGGRNLSKAIAGKGSVNATSEKVSVMFSLEDNTDNILFLMEMANEYTLVLMDEANKEQIILLNCKKTQQFDKMFIGDVVEIK